MAEIWPDEGLDIVLEIFPRGGTNLTTTYLALFTSFTGTTVGTSGQAADTYTEPTFGSYARQSTAAASWGAIAAGTGGRKTTAAQVTFPTATSNSSSATNGFWLANQLSASGDKAILAANFDDATPVTVNTNDIIRVTPTAQANN
jgi:hypothetical protein